MSRLDTRTLKDELTSMDRRCLLDLGHPLLNRVADSFIRAAGVGAARAVSREAYFVTVQGTMHSRVVRVRRQRAAGALLTVHYYDLQGFQGTRPGWTPTAARGTISPASEVMTVRGRSTQWYVTNTAQSCDLFCRFINRYFFSLTCYAKLAAGKNGWQGGLPVG